MTALRKLPAILALALAASACAAAPPGPRGPLMGPGIELATDWSYAYGPGEATLDDGTSTRGGADYYWSDVAVFPRRLEGRLSPLKWVDVGGQIGWIGGGADARIGLPAIDGRWLAFDFAAGFETGEAGFFKETKPTRAKWLRLETYPLLPIPRQQVRLILAVGVDFGMFHHELADPRPEVEFNDGLAPSHVQTIRRETRLETSIGVFYAPARFATVQLTVNPYFVLDAGSPERACDACAIAGYRQQWGIVVVTRLALRRGF
jgi:hypothetical protein